VTPPVSGKTGVNAPQVAPFWSQRREPMGRSYALSVGKGTNASETGAMKSNAMRKTRTLESVPCYDDRKPLLRNSRNPFIGAHADYRREDYIFAREQSLVMREMEWERRTKPLKCWGSNMVANLAWAIFA
jgi:hypothetical protein